MRPRRRPDDLVLYSSNHPPKKLPFTLWLIVENTGDSQDFFCDNGTSPDALAIHEGYVLEYGSQAAQYVVDKIRDCSSSSSS